ncbi:hypothetical protein LAD12857_28920 [Lacrimispora amygdalina]|uniref:MarR family transcriptional regulator n=1 Tax=Lacrimispora amygdalina TaxID=253257 RepID=A0ABQ5M7N5_9FIRM
MSSPMMKPAEVAEIMDCSIATGYNIIKGLNAELESKGFITRRARIPRKYFYERTGLDPESDFGKEEVPHAEVL